MVRLFSFWVALFGLVLLPVRVGAQPAPPASSAPHVASSAAPPAASAAPPAASAASAPGASAPSASAPSEAAKPPETGAPTSGEATPATTARASGAPGAGEAAKAGETAPVDGSTYAVRMRDLAQRIDDLKEQIRRSHTRLSLLSDTILSGGVGGARAEIRFVNDLSSAFRLTSALFVLDGQVQYNKQDDSGALAEQKAIPVFTGSIPPGDHTLQVQLKLQGYGYGVFSYLRGYRFQTGASHSFTVTEGKVIVLEAIAWEKGGVTTPLEERPAVRFKQTIKAGSGEGTEAPTRAPAAGTRATGGASVDASAGGK
jgi:hypothetical protein